MRELIEKIKKYFVEKIIQAEENFQSYYIVVENTKYHELINEFSNTYSVYKVKKSRMIGEIHDLVEEGFVTIDQAENLVNALVVRESGFNKEGKRILKEYKLKESNV